MRKVILLIALFTFTAQAKDKVVPYLSIGAGYKVLEELWIICSHEKPCNWRLARSHPITARLDAGIEYKSLRMGITHHSQYFQGKPFTGDRREYTKNELYVDYILRWE